MMEKVHTEGKASKTCSWPTEIVTHKDKEIVGSTCVTEVMEL